MPPSDPAAVPPRGPAAVPGAGRAPRDHRRPGLPSLLGAVLTATALVTALVVGVPGAAQRADAAGADCGAGSVLNVVAHPDDDLLFQGTQLRADVDAGRCVRSVVVTAGDAGYPRWYWGDRQTGLMAAYARIAGVPSAWTTGSTVVAGHTLHTETLAAAPRISLVFLELPDGNVEGNGFWADGYQSLEHLYEGSLAAITSVADATHPTSYTLADLRATLLALVRSTAPSSIHTLDHEGTYGDGDHSDHHTVAYLTDEVQRTYGTAHDFTGYVGYPIADRPSNLTAAQTDAKADAFFAYAAHDDQTCTSRAACADRWEDAWFSRQYTVGATGTDPGTTPTPDPGSGTGPTPGTGTGTAGPQPTTTNVAGTAVVTASAENPADGQTARAAVDGVVSGYPDAPTAEWVAPAGRAGTWIQLDWPAGAAGAAGAAGVALQAVELADRPNTDDQVTGGILTFSDGSSVPVPSLADGGAVQRVTFSLRRVTWVRFTITAVSATTKNAGLAEVRALAATDTTEPTPSNPSVNAARTAVVTASADNPRDRQTAAKTADGVVSGWPADPSAEWAAPGGGVGTWVQYDWPSGVALQSADLADRSNTDDRVTGGTLTFSDGSRVAVPALPDDGTVTSVPFPARQVTWMRFTVTGVSGTTKNTGLAELRAWTVPAGTGTGTTPAPTTLRDVTAAATPSASSDNPADGQTVAKAVDGVVSGWPARADAEWVSPGGRAGTWLRLDWTTPVTLRRIVLHDRPNAVDRVTSGTLTFSDGSAVRVGALPDDGSASTLDVTPRDVTWVRFTVDTVAAGTENAGLAEFRAWAAS